MRIAKLIGMAGLIALILASILLAEIAVHPPHSAPDLTKETLLARQFAKAPGAASRLLEISAADGVLLHGWLFTPPRPNRAAVILLHGVADTWRGVLGQAKFLLDAGYVVLAPDSRGHGSSGGNVVTYGLLESGDVHRWADLLLLQPGIDRLYGAGQSMGAAILIQSAAREPRIRAISADCPFATFEEIAFDRLAQNGVPGHLLAWPPVQLGFLYARLRYAVDLRRASPAAALRTLHTPTLLIHGTADSNIPIRHSRELHAVNPSVSELWEVSGAEHVECVSYAPKAYAERVTRFFGAHF